jgi:hypothetical protein
MSTDPTPTSRAAEVLAVEVLRCPVHSIPDCSPLLNGCSIPNWLATAYERGRTDAGLPREHEPRQGALTEATPESRDAVMDPWCRIARADGWEVDADPIYWAAVDGLAWSLIEQTMDTADREPGPEILRDARATAERALTARGGTAAAGDEGLREPVLAWIDGVREWAEALKAAPEAATASSRGIGRDLTGHLSALRDITEGWDELGTAEVVSSLRTAALDATLAPAAAQPCPDCGHAHTPDGCTGDPTPSDLWAGVSVSGCDCEYDQATLAPTEAPAPSQDTLRAAVEDDR